MANGEDVALRVRFSGDLYLPGACSPSVPLDNPPLAAVSMKPLCHDGHRIGATRYSASYTSRNPVWRIAAVVGTQAALTCMAEPEVRYAATFRKPLISLFLSGDGKVSK